MRRGPVVPQVVGLEHVAHAVDHVGLEVRLVERRRGEGQETLRQPVLRFDDPFRLGHVFGIFQMALDLAFIDVLPAPDEVSIRAAHAFGPAQQDVAALARGGKVVAEGEGMGRNFVIVRLFELVQLRLVEEILHRHGIVFHPEQVPEGEYEIRSGQRLFLEHGFGKRHVVQHGHAIDHESLLDGR